jgi:glycogen debranching enzyme
MPNQGNHMTDFALLPFPELKTSSPAIDRAYRIALGDLIGNIRMFKDGLLNEPKPVLLAGLDYDTPWTRDAAINVWNGVGLYWPGVARNTLLSVLERRHDTIFIGGQYWDAIIWAVGAWSYYLQTGDREFLSIAFEAVRNSLAYFEKEEFDEQAGLFRGPAVYGDGVSAYPDRYSPGNTSSILDWVKANPDKKVQQGFGIPMKTLSTNCVYAHAYHIASLMSHECGADLHPIYEARAEQLVDRIRKYFWNYKLGTLNYLIDSEGVSDFQEGLGHAFAMLFHVATAEQSASILSKQHITSAGIPCVWPSFPRYSALSGYGRHSGTVWPFISGFWGEAALRNGRSDLFEREFMILTENINRSGQCAEIYDPDTAEVYGGLQENGGGPNGMEWTSCARQSWTASAYVRLLINGLFGLQFSMDGITFSPHLPPDVNHAQMNGLRYRGCTIDLTVEGRGARVIDFQRNNEKTTPFLSANTRGVQHIQNQVGD